MSTVIKNKIHIAKKYHICDGCRGQIVPGVKYRRLFGTPHESDPLRELKLCNNCTDINTQSDGHSDIMYAG